MTTEEQAEAINMVHRYKNWQLRSRLKRVVKGRHWIIQIDYIDSNIERIIYLHYNL